MAEPKQQPPYPLRMPDDMRFHLEDEAAQERRSLNAHIVAALQERQSLRNEVESLRHELRASKKRESSSDFALLLAKLESSIAKLELQVAGLKHSLYETAMRLKLVMNGSYQTTPERWEQMRYEVETLIKDNEDAIGDLGNRMTIDQIASTRVRLLSEKLLALERGEAVADDGAGERAIKLARARAAGFDPAEWFEHGALKNPFPGSEPTAEELPPRATPKLRK